jgi:hypothetical protein
MVSVSVYLLACTSCAVVAIVTIAPFVAILFALAG